MKTKKHINDFIAKIQLLSPELDLSILHKSSNEIYEYYVQQVEETPLSSIWFSLWEWHVGFLTDKYALHTLKDKL